MQAPRRSHSHSRTRLIRGGFAALAGMSVFPGLISLGVAWDPFTWQMWVVVIIALMNMVLCYFFVARRREGNPAEGEKAASADSLPAAPADRRRTTHQ
jgi:hypothetical protein